MRRIALSLLALTTLAAGTGAGLVPTAQAETGRAPAPRHHSATSPNPITTSSRPLARLVDPRGDVRAKTGSLEDTASNSFDGFSPGKGTSVAATAADQAIDLSGVTYRITGGKAAPRLKATYRANGPFHLDTHTSGTPGDVGAAGAGDFAMRADFDGLETIIGGGRYALEAYSGRGRRSLGIRSGLFRNNDRHRRVPCNGLRTHMPTGGSTATQSIPLTCLTGLGITSARLRAVSAHITVDVGVTSTTATGPSGTTTSTTTTDAARFASDVSPRSWRMPFAGQLD